MVATFRVYDTSGPYTDDDAAIDVKRGLAPLRTPWIEARGGVETYEGRAVKPEDNGNVGEAHLARAFKVTRQPLRGLPGKPVTQLELARAGIVTNEMVYIAHRENIGRMRAPKRRKRGSATARISAPRCRHSSRRSSCATRWRAAAPSSRPTSITPNPSR